MESYSTKSSSTLTQAWLNGNSASLIKTVTCRFESCRLYMKLNDYQKKAEKTAIYPAQGMNYSYPALGLVGEAGEVAEKIKKVIRDKDGVLDANDKGEIAKELGDVLWYIAILASEMGVSLNTVATMNLKKLQSRKERGKLGGSGDNR